MAKSKYDSHVKDNLVLVTSWARDGLTDLQIAHNLGISEDTFYTYKNKYTEFSEALKKGKEVIDFEVENALLKRAFGYKYDEITKELVDGVMVETKRVTKEVQPDTTAQIFWLKNRKPKEWRDKKDVEMSGELKTESENKVSLLSTEDLKTLVDEIKDSD